MLRGLDIRDMLIIDRLELTFQPGLNVLTGETGAGKSILLDSLGFVLGWRGRAELVRTGSEQGEVQAWFDLPKDHMARAVLEEHGLPVEDELILRRINTREGRKTAWVNDRRCSGEVLRKLSETLIELHGQHDDRGLLNPSGHRGLLDSFGKLDDLRAGTRTAWRALAQARGQLKIAEAKLEEIRVEEDFLRHAVAELEALAPQIGEDEKLDTERRLMQSAERIRDDIAKAQGALGHDGAEGSASDAMRWLEGAAESAEGILDEAMSALSRAMVELDEAAGSVSRCLEQLHFDPLELEHAEERLFAIRAMARKHEVQSEELPKLALELRQRLNQLEQGDADLKALVAAVETAQRNYDQAAEKLSKARKTAAKALDKAVTDELAPLKMERAVFETDFELAEDGAEGRDAVTFRVATNPGAPSGPLAKIASGGELSRFLLALKVCLAGDEGAITMIFDEIDRGVGGATADAVGRRLAQLAGQGQVLVVTHSPQVAALAAHHWRVEKRVENEMTLSTVTPLNSDDRIDEIARMLSGDRITDAARSAASALMST